MDNKTPAKRSIRKRSFLLFELLISLTLITMCFFPLIKSHFFVRLASLNQLKEMQLERGAQAAFCELKTKLYEKKHSWKQLLDQEASGELSPFTAYTGKNKCLSYSCRYTISLPPFPIANKPTQNKIGLVICVDFVFTHPQSKEFTFQRTLYLERITA